MERRGLRDPGQPGIDRSTRLTLLANAKWAQLRHARTLVEMSYACLAATRRQLAAEDGPQGAAGGPARRATGGDARARSEPDVGTPASWTALSDGSPEQDAAVAEAVREIVELQYLLIEGISRHFPALAPDIRRVAQHLLEYAPNLVDPACCERARTAGTSGPKTREN